MPKNSKNYCQAILEAHEYLLDNYPEVFVIGQGLWSPWYVGSSMKDLDKRYGRSRIMDTPVSEDATTGIAIGASLCGYRPIVVHPRVDFMILATNALVNQAAKWSHMLGGQAHPSVLIRGIVNRGGEQGAQHSQALHSWFAHIPGLRVVTPATVYDARDLFIAGVLCDDPVLYIDDRWLYELEDELSPVNQNSLLDLKTQGPKILRDGADVTLVGCSYSTQLCLESAKQLERQHISAEVVDVRVLNPLDPSLIIHSVTKTGRLCVVDGGWRNCGFAAEVIALATERIPLSVLKANPFRITLPNAPAPTSRSLEDIYYPKIENIVAAVNHLMQAKGRASEKSRYVPANCDVERVHEALS